MKIFIQTSGIGDSLDYCSLPLIYHYHWTSSRLNPTGTVRKIKVKTCQGSHLSTHHEHSMTKHKRSYRSFSTEPSKSIRRKDLIPINHTVLWIYIIVLSSPRISGPWVPPLILEVRCLRHLGHQRKFVSSFYRHSCNYFTHGAMEN